MGVHLVHRDLEPLGVDGRRPRTWVIRGEHTRAERTVRLHTLAPWVGRELICRVGSGVPILERGGRRWGVPPTPGWAQPGSGQSGHEQRLTQASSPRCARRSFVEEHQARRIFAGLGDTSSNEVIRATGTPDGAGGDPFDKTTVTIIDTDVIPPTLVRMGLDKCSDTFTLIHRAAFIEDPQAREEHFGPPQGTVLRLTPATVTSIADLQPYPVPDLKVRGADHVIDYTREDFTQGEQRHDFILDNVSKRSLSRLRRALTPEGALVPNGGRFDDRWMARVGNAFRASVSSLFVRQNPRPFLSPPNHEDLVALKELMETGKVAPGGVSWVSTIEYYRIMNEMVRGRFGLNCSAAILLCSIPFGELARQENLAARGDCGPLKRTIVDAARRDLAGLHELLQSNQVLVIRRREERPRVLAHEQ